MISVSHLQSRSIAAIAAGILAVGGSAHAQHAGDIGLLLEDDRLVAYGPIGCTDMCGVHYGVFGDTGFPGYTSNPGVDALPGTFPPGRIGFRVLEGLRRWDDDASVWRAPEEVPEVLSISYITLEVLVEDEAEEGFDLAVQPDGGWHRHVDFELLPGKDGIRQPGIYRLDLQFYSTMGLADSEPFTIAFNYEASSAEAQAALESIANPPVDCPGDIDGNGIVDGADFGLLLAAFNTADPSADLDGDGLVNGADIGSMLAFWGPCP